MLRAEKKKIGSPFSSNLENKDVLIIIARVKLSETFLRI